MSKLYLCIALMMTLMVFSQCNTSDFSLPTGTEIEQALEKIWDAIPTSYKQAGLKDVSAVESYLLNMLFAKLPIPTEFKSMLENLIQEEVQKFVDSHLTFEQFGIFDLGVHKGNRTPAQAVAWGMRQINGPAVWHDLCDHFVTEAYGLSGGYASAIDQWNAAPHKHRGDTNPPAGALVFWESSPYGHVALSIGNGWILSTDIKRAGHVDKVRLGEIHKKWGLPYLGWAPAYFP